MFKTPAFIIASATAAVISLSAAAAPFQLGDANLGGTSLDTANQSRINIELDSVNLAAGTYNVNQFEVDTDGTGDVTPLLFIRNGANNGYNVLWVGSNIGVTGAGITTTNYTPGTEQFTLAAPTDVFVGAWHDGVARVRFLNGGVTDHDGGNPQSPTTFAVDDSLLDSDITNSGLGRTYMIQASVELVPEPSSLALLSLLALSVSNRRGLPATRRRR